MAYPQDANAPASYSYNSSSSSSTPPPPPPSSSSSSTEAVRHLDNDSFDCADYGDAFGACGRLSSDAASVMNTQATVRDFEQRCPKLCQ